MIIVMIHWKIKANAVDDFLKFWKEAATVEDRTGLFGEFLSRVEDVSAFPYITWLEQPANREYVSFVNVGIWPHEQAFAEQIAPKFNDDNPPLPFEFERRVRTVIRPEWCRLGEAQLPMVEDSPGVR